jgi:hypothetical protein
MSHLPKNHPVRLILDTAALTGRLPTSRDLDLLQGHEADLPDGQTLARLRTEVSTAARRVVNAREGGNYGAAQEVAGDAWSTIAARMTPEMAAIDRTSPDPEDVTDIAARMFGPL